MSGCKPSALIDDTAGVDITTRSARLLPNTNPDWVGVEPVEAVETAVLVATDYINTTENTVT